ALGLRSVLPRMPSKPKLLACRLRQRWRSRRGALIHCTWGAMENLLCNALQHTPQGGAVRIAAHAEGSHLRLRVSDTGSGVAPEVLPRLFEPFVTSRAAGTGLGLALVREIAMAHDGSVQLVGAAPGACFDIEIPWLPS